MFNLLGFESSKRNKQHSFTIKALYAFGGGHKPATVQPAKSESVFGNTDNATIGNDFGVSTSSKGSDGSLKTQTNLAQPLQQAGNNAAGAVNSGLGYLQQSPGQVMGSITNGSNPYYNALQSQSNLALQQQAGKLANQAQQSGNADSTAYGNALGALNYYNGQLQSGQNAINALNLGNQMATNQVNSGMGVLNPLYNYESGLGGLSNNDLLGALNEAQSVDLANAGYQQQANLANQQAQNQYIANQNAGLGSLLGAGLGAAGYMLGGPIGGAIAGGMGSMFGGNNGGAISNIGMTAPSYLPSVYQGMMGNTNPFGYNALTGQQYGMGVA